MASYIRKGQFLCIKFRYFSLQKKISGFQRQVRIISKMVAYAQERDLNSLFVKLPHEDEATMFENDLKGLNYQYIFEFWRKNSLL